MSTIKEISKRAGVSPTTVSNVIHGRLNKVSPETRKKVEAYLDEVNYAPNMAASILAHENSRIVGVLFYSETRRNETQLEDPFSSTILGNIEWELRKMGYFMMVHTTNDENEVLRFVKSWKLAGLIILWVPRSVIPRLNKEVSCPVVCIDSYDVEDDMHYYRIGIEDKRAGYLVAKHLLSKGHRDIRFLASALEAADIKRFQGMREAYADQGFPLTHSSFSALSMVKEERYRLYRELASVDSSCTALFCTSDYYASEAISYYHEIGIRVPEDISVVGFDDSIFARIVTPGITTIHQETGEKGRFAVDMLIKLIEGKTVTPHHVTLPVRLVERDSVKDLL